MRFIKIGKDESNDIFKDFINDPTVSRFHCEIFLDDEGNKFLTDKDSTNGTYLNGNKISAPQKLGDYDIVKIGNSVVDWKSFLDKEMKLKIKRDLSNLKEVKGEFNRFYIGKTYKWLIILLLIVASFFIIHKYYNTSLFSNESKEEWNGKKDPTLITPENNELEKKAAAKKEKEKKEKLAKEAAAKKEKERKVKLARQAAAKKERERKERIAEEKRKTKKVNFDIDSPDITPIPRSGHSPYDNFFGKGIYHNTQNSIKVTAPEKTHVVFIVINTYSGKRIRNEFIRKGETFEMEKIPYGTYDYMYFTGRNWSNTETLNNGKIKGGFKDYKSFNKNKTGEDQIKFKKGYYGIMTIKLTQIVGGNLETKTTNENDFFN